MPRCVWIVLAFSPRDGGWMRIFDTFKVQRYAWQAVEFFWQLMVLHGDYETVEVKRTIAFRNKAWDVGWTGGVMGVGWMGS